MALLGALGVGFLANSKALLCALLERGMEEKFCKDCLGGDAEQVYNLPNQVSTS